MGLRSTKGMLTHIQDRQGADRVVCRLFKKYDRDRSGYLEGSEYERFIEDVTSFIVAGFAEEGVTVRHSVVRLWVKPTLDHSRDGRLSLEEVQTNLRAVLAATDSAALRQMLEAGAPEKTETGGGSAPPRKSPRPTTFAVVPLQCR